MLRRIAKELRLDVSASVEDLRQIVSGQIESEGREPRNVRVELLESDEGTTVTLQDEEGVFLECTPVVDEEEVGGREERELDDGDGELVGRDGVESGRTGGACPTRAEDERAEFEEALNRLTSENTSLTEDNALLIRQMEELQKEVSELKVKVTEEKNKYKYLWRESLEQLREHDERMSDKDAEIKMLKSRLAGLGVRRAISDDPACVSGERAKSVRRSVRAESMCVSVAERSEDPACMSETSPRMSKRAVRTEPVSTMSCVWPPEMRRRGWLD